MPFNFLCCVRPGVEDVVELDYSHQSLSDVPNEVFVHERTLESLICKSNRITELPRQLFMCHGLKYLDLSDNELQSIPTAISSLVNLQYLNVSRNSLSSIPDTMKALKYLTFLDLSINPLEKLPDAITNLIALQELYLNDTYLEYLPGNFGRLANLRILELRDNYLMILPKSLSRSMELERLDIGQNEFQQFPEVVGRFLKLKELWIDSNNLTDIPATIKPLQNLIHLEASNNMIEELAPEIGHCVGLVDISLSSNTLTHLPDTIGCLVNLTTLKIDNNRLFSLPDTIGNMNNLEELMLMCNCLDMIPSSIGLLRKLQYLNVDENLLRFIPPEIGSCTKLSVLSARSNKLTRLPPEIGHLSSLKVLNLVRNSLTCLPQSLLNCDNLVALWLSENQSKPLVPMHSEMDPQTYEQILTCYLFPQVPLSPNEPTMGNDKSENNDTLNTSRHISFVDMKATPKVPEKPGQLRRAPTPYPKELRALAKHARNIQKDGTQDVTNPMQNPVHIKAAKITPTLQQRFASDNKKDLDCIKSDNADRLHRDMVKTSVYDNLPDENTYDKPLELSNELDKTYKSVDHALYTDSNTSNDFKENADHFTQDIYAARHNNDVYSCKQDVYKANNLVLPPSVYDKNNEHNHFKPDDSYRSSMSEMPNRLQRFSISSQDRRSNNESVLSNFHETPYSQMPLIDSRPVYEQLPVRKATVPPICHSHNVVDGNYHDNIYSTETYAQAKEKMYGQRNYDAYGYHTHSAHHLPNSRIPTVSQVVSNSVTMPNLNFTKVYDGSDAELQHYPSSVHGVNTNSGAYGVQASSPTYIPSQSPELYSPTGHTSVTNPYRMTNTPLISDDGSYVHSTASQNMYDLYDTMQPSTNLQGGHRHHSPSNMSTTESIYGRQPPPYHIAAPYTKHAQYFNGTGG